jgi:hypothetical protein
MLAIGCIPWKEDQYLSLGSRGQDEDGFRDDSRAESFISDYSIARAGVIGRGDSRSIPIEAYEFAERDVEDEPRTENIMKAFQNLRSASIRGFERYRPPVTVSSLLQDYSRSTYVPPTADWIRLNDGNLAPDTDIYFRGSQMQCLVYCVLKLAWHEESYLVGGRSRDLPMRLFAQAAKILPQLMSRLRNGSGSLQLDNETSNNLLRVMEPLEARGLKITSSQRCVKELFNLDRVLQGLCHRNEQINYALSVLMIINREFTNLIAESARHLAAIDPALARLEINLHNGNVWLPSGFGFKQTFAVDMEALFPGEQRDQQTKMVEYPVLLFCCLRACVRSSMLHNTLDSKPLLDVYDKMGDIMYVNSGIVNSSKKKYYKGGGTN